ncbi:MAG TPA: methyl-accepting chemotaxis protein, partial [Aliidongia sp.]|nr:methyl-accepting chemotaxis protein [Aliidongia sp.]
MNVRLYLGFGALILIGIAVAGFGSWQLESINDRVAEMGRQSDNVVRVLQTGRLTALMRLYRLRYIAEEDEALAKQFHEAQSQAVDMMKAAAQTTRSEERRRLYNQLQGLVAEHGTKFDEVVGIVKQRADERSKLFSGGDALTAMSDKLVAAARETKDAGLVQTAVAAERTVLLVRIANWRYLATRDPKGVATFDTNHGNAVTALGAFDKAPESIRPLVASVAAALDAYAGSFKAHANLLQKSSDLSDQMLAQATEMQKQLDASEASLITAFATTKTITDETVSSTITWQAILAVIAALLGSTLAYLISRSIVRPVSGMTAAMKLLAGGNISVEIPGHNDGGEIGAMAAAVEVFKRNAIEKQRLEAQELQDQAARSRRQEEIDQLVGFFGRSIGGVFTAVSNASSSMSATSASLQASSGETGDQARLVLAEIEETSATVQTVAAASQELSSSIDEIGRQASESSRISTGALQQSDEVTAKVSELRTAAQQIGNVIQLINNIAGQTNLLALNATIEAARAG